MPKAPLIVDSFEHVELRTIQGSYDRESQTWSGETDDKAAVVATRQTHHRGEDH